MFRVTRVTRVTTVIKKYDGIAVTQPKAEQLKKVKNKKDLSYIWVTKDGIVSINDRIMNIEDIENIASLIMENNNNTTFLLKIDEVGFTAKDAIIS